MLYTLALVLVGILMAEGLGYAWHRWVAHIGVFRRVLNDFLRRRHWDHHIEKYPPYKRPRFRDYIESCEITFRVMGAVVLLVLLAMVPLGILSWWEFGVLGVTAGAYGLFVLGGLHTLYHLEDSVVRSFRLWKPEFMWRIFCWLRDYHDVHHVVNGNYVILLPIFDIIFGSYVSPKKFKELKAESLFPNFRGTGSSCGESIFKA